jgi:hypothetical protein
VSAIEWWALAVLCLIVIVAYALWFERHFSALFLQGTPPGID